MAKTNLAGISTFFQETKAELSKVVWPTRKQTIKLTTIVIGVSVGVALYVGILDLAFTKLIDALLIR